MKLQSVNVRKLFMQWKCPAAAEPLLSLDWRVGRSWMRFEWLPNRQTNAAPTEKQSEQTQRMCLIKCPKLLTRYFLMPHWPQRQNVDRGFGVTPTISHHHQKACLSQENPSLSGRPTTTILSSAVLPAADPPDHNYSLIREMSSA